MVKYASLRNQHEPPAAPPRTQTEVYIVAFREEIGVEPAALVKDLSLDESTCEASAPDLHFLRWCFRNGPSVQMIMGAEARRQHDSRAVHQRGICGTQQQRLDSCQVCWTLPKLRQ